MNIKNNILIKLSLVSCLIFCGFWLIAQNDLFIYKNGSIIFQGSTENIDQVKIEDNKTKISIYDTSGKTLYSEALTQIDSITLIEKPIADVLDVVFNEDGSATDISPMKNNIEAVGTKTYYNDIYNRYVSTFDNTWAGKTSSYYKINYADNQAFKDALADGHTLEAVVMANYESPIANGEAKFFASHERGGTGLMVCKTNNGMNETNELTFLPNVSSGNSTWRWGTSGIVPQPREYYHIIGVWNKEEAKVYIYINGELKNTVDTEGNFIFPVNGSDWFAIGCDAGPTAQLGWSGDVVIARIYDKPLKDTEVKLLWNDIEKLQKKPVADILDVVFKTDGTAEDISPMKNVITTNNSGALSTYYSNTYKRFVAKFGNTWAGATSGFYRIDYANNEAFKEALKDGHTLEAVVMADFEPPISNGEAKFFSSHETGGTGLMVCKTDRGLNGKNELSFLPHVGGDWKFVTSGIAPQPQIYYHIIGTWNKEEGKARIYINGELKNTIEAVGEFKFPKDNSNWFAIGCDAGPTAQLGWSGDVVLARIYDNPLTPHDVAVLWDEVKKLQENAVVDMVSDIDFISGIAVKIGATYNISGTGFTEDDKVIFTSVTDASNIQTLNCTLNGENGIYITIPEGFQSGQYRMMLLRGENRQDLGLTKLQIVTKMPQPAQIIAHRGYWDTEGSAQNSLTAIRKAQELNLYGSELDIWLTTDGHLVLNHDATLNGVTIQNSTYEQVKDLTLSNGEKIAQLSDCLTLIKESESPTKLIIEIKTHSTAERNMAAAKAAVEAVAESRMQNKVEYIAFDLDICKKIVSLDASAKVSYLAGGIAPETLHTYGISGLDYHIQEFRDNPQWIKQAKDRGMSVNVWTVNSIGDIAEMTNAGVQFVTTDKPLDALKVKQYYENNQ